MVDDFGLHAGICEASLRLLALDRVHAIGCQVGGESWTAWRHRLRSLASDQVDVGLHLDLSERPLIVEPQPIGRLLSSSLLRRLDMRKLRAEVRAQLDAFEDALGRGPAFVDGHQHVHQLPVVRDVLLDELSRRYRTALPWLRSTRAVNTQRDGEPRAWRDAAKARIIETLGAAELAKRARRLGFQQNAALCGVYDFSDRQVDYLARLDGWLQRCRTGDLLMCHPSTMRDSRDVLAEARVAEFEALASDRFRALLREHEIGLEPMSRILGRRRAAA